MTSCLNHMRPSVHTTESPAEASASCKPSDSDAPSCWICLQDSAEVSEALLKPCRCPRYAHLKCLARWQLQSAGKSEESACRFCHQELPDWKASLASTSDVGTPVLPVMAIKYNGKTYKLRVKPGPDGLRDFQIQVRRLLGFDITDDFNVTFQCSVPQSGERMMLSGLSSYGAATHCAAIAAAQRGGNTPTAATSSTNSASRPVHSHRSHSSALSTSPAAFSTAPHRRRSIAETESTAVVSSSVGAAEQQAPGATPAEIAPIRTSVSSVPIQPASSLAAGTFSASSSSSSNAFSMSTPPSSPMAPITSLRCESLPANSSASSSTAASAPSSSYPSSLPLSSTSRASANASRSQFSRTVGHLLASASYSTPSRLAVSGSSSQSGDQQSTVEATPAAAAAAASALANEINGSVSSVRCMLQRTWQQLHKVFSSRSKQ